MQYISLIIPAKNEKESLEKTIREILNYKFINEIIIVVDSHQDNSIEISKKINNNKIKVIIQKPRQGEEKYANTGFKNY
jgi:glycosyltransferase involved in cell wall biosynthesis